MGKIKAEPYDFDFDLDATALVMIDMQRDFVEPGGFGESLGNDVSLLRSSIEPCKELLETARKAGMFVIHTREGHRPDLADLQPAKKARGNPTLKIGDPGPMGRLLVRGEPGHELIPELAPAEGEPVIDKPGKGAFYETDLLGILRNRGIKKLIVCGVTTEVCVHTTVREANDRGFDALVPEDCTASYFPEFKRVALEMITAQGGIFGWVSDSDKVIKGLEEAAKSK
ncbi:MAG: cysteine hydrolase [Chloroflexi bacterium CFX2]|nr:cysteine hydrolase [Chloroflexi bacterium CFX2]